MAQMNDAMLVQVANRFSALADVSRLRILDRLRHGPCNVTTLSRELDIGQASVSKHLAVLRTVGLVAVERRGTQVICRVNDPTVFEMCKVVCSGVVSFLRERQDAVLAGLTGGDQTSFNPKEN